MLEILQSIEVDWTRHEAETWTHNDKPLSEYKIESLRLARLDEE